MSSTTLLSINVSLAASSTVTVKTVFGNNLGTLTEGDCRTLLTRVAREKAAIKELDLGKVAAGSYQDRELNALDAARVMIIDRLNNLEVTASE